MAYASLRLRSNLSVTRAPQHRVAHAVVQRANPFAARGPSFSASATFPLAVTATSIALARDRRCLQRVQPPSA